MTTSSSLAQFGMRARLGIAATAGLAMVLLAGLPLRAEEAKASNKPKETGQRVLQAVA